MAEQKMAEQKEILPADQILPNKLFLIALNGKPIFPGLFTPLMITTPEDLEVVQQALDGDKHIGLVMTRDEEAEDIGVDDLHEVGTVAKILKRINLPDGGMNVFVSTLKRFRIRKKLSTEQGPMVAAVDYLDDEESDTDEVQALTRAIIAETKQVSENNPLFSEEMRLNMVNIDQPGKDRRLRHQHPQHRPRVSTGCFGDAQRTQPPGKGAHVYQEGTGAPADPEKDPDPD